MTSKPNCPATFTPRHVFWVASLYLAMGIPYNVINGTSVRMFKSLGFADSQITVAVGSIGIAWSLKPLWAAFLDMYRTKRFFVLTMELLCGCLFAAIAMAVSEPGFFQIAIALLWVAAFASSTQDICADGIYLTALDKPAQARFAGLQGAFWVLGKVLATGLLISVLFKLQSSYGWSEQTMWRHVMLSCAAAMGLLALYHLFVLPTGSRSSRPSGAAEVWRDFSGTATAFFHKRAFWGMIAFVFLYRLGEGLILMEGQLFLQSSTAQGGLGLSAGQVSDIDAVYGTLASIAGGLLGGAFAAKLGLRRSLWILGLSLNIPHVTFLLMGHYAAAGQGMDYSAIVALVSIEKFGYGFGMVGNMIYLMQQLAPGRWAMTHYAFATALMNLVLVPTAMISGPLAEWLGFSSFFLLVMLASVPSVLAAWRAPFPQQEEDARAVFDAGAGGVQLTVDDPTRLSAVELKVQAIAGRASMFAMLGILMILIADAAVLGSLQGRAPGSGLTQLLLLVALLLPKALLARRTFALAAQAALVAGPAGERHYLGNAKGAKIATWISAAVSLAVLVFCAQRLLA
ncbi:MFS transporter [Roseateles sp.]|uniref:MFS transporter n=1 Tax=Roseateles sp. TaxID=1971397 RepID=UPI00286AEF09|nr:MFS transporter [Roseateles sp.]